jgi:hypothetical protein
LTALLIRPRLAPIGRARRDASRADKLAGDAETLIFAGLPWLRGASKAPPSAKTDIAAARDALRRLAETADEARLLSEALHVAIDRWNHGHPDDLLSVPPPITAIKA